MIASQCLLARRWEYSDMKSTSHCRTVWTLSADWCHLCRFQEIVYGGRNSLFMSSVWVLPSFIDTREAREFSFGRRRECKGPGPRIRTRLTSRCFSY
ncbi:hypothetical protein KP509_1Z228000 [Ceratopteris richardii]|nr:hypothetical protein KP509_1Z228000 [Ceratopteris richardii]